MALSELIKVAYTSAPTSAMVFRTFQIYGTGITTINLVHDYFEQDLGGVIHEPCQLSYRLPAKDTTGNQKLNFALGLVDARAQKAIRAAIAADTEVYLMYREFLESDRSTPARTPIIMTIVGGACEPLSVQVEAQYFDMLNFSWPRERYTADKAPGTKYL